MFVLKWILIIITTPIVVYFSVKLGTVAYFKGKQFIENQNKSGVKNGQEDQEI